MSSLPPQDHDLPPEVQDALDRKLARWLHRLLEITAHLCYDYYFAPTMGDHHDAYEAEFDKLKFRHPALGEPFDDHPRYVPNNLFFVRAYFRSFIESMAVALSPSRSSEDHPPPFEPIWTYLLEIAEAHGHDIARVKEQAFAVIERHRPSASLWWRLACDGNADKPVDQWRGPMLLAGKVGKFSSHDFERDQQLLPMDAARSAALLKAAEDKWESTLKGYIQIDADDAILKAATAETAKSAGTGKMIDGEPAQRPASRAKTGQTPALQAPKAPKGRPRLDPALIAEAKQLHDAGLGPKQIAERLLTTRAVDVSPGAVSKWLQRHAKPSK